MSKKYPSILKIFKFSDLAATSPLSLSVNQTVLNVNNPETNIWNVNKLDVSKVSENAHLYRKEISTEYNYLAATSQLSLFDRNDSRSF